MRPQERRGLRHDLLGELGALRGFIGFRGNAFRNPGGLVTWLGTRKGTIRLRQDHKLAIVRDMHVTERLSLGRDVLTHLTRIAGAGAKAA